MKLKKLDNKVALLKMFISGIIAFVFAMSYVMSVRAEHTVVKSDDGMAGDTAYDCLLKLEEFSVYSGLGAEDESELSIWGYVCYSLDENEIVLFSAADQCAYSIGAWRYTPFLTRYAYSEYHISSDTGSDYLILDVKP